MKTKLLVLVLLMIPILPTASIIPPSPINLDLIITSGGKYEGITYNETVLIDNAGPVIMNNCVFKKGLSIDSNNVIIANSTVEGTGTSYNLWVLPSENVTVTNNYIKNDVNNFVLVASGSNILFENNIIESRVEFETTNHVKFVDNNVTLEFPTRDYAMEMEGRNYTIINNIITNRGGAAPAVRLRNVYPDRFDFINNTVTSSSVDYAIISLGSDPVNSYDNTFLLEDAWAPELDVGDFTMIQGTYELTVNIMESNLDYVNFTIDDKLIPISSDPTVSITSDRTVLEGSVEHYPPEINNTLILEYKLDKLGVHTGKITATDSFGLSTSDSFQITVEQDIYDPVIPSIPDQTIHQQADELKLDLNIIEHNNYTYDVYRNGELIHNNISDDPFVINSTLPLGEYDYVITVYDFYGHSSSTQFSLTILPDTIAPDPKIFSYGYNATEKVVYFSTVVEDARYDNGTYSLLYEENEIGSGTYLANRPVYLTGQFEEEESGRYQVDLILIDFSGNNFTHTYVIDYKKPGTTTTTIESERSNDTTSEEPDDGALVTITGFEYLLIPIAIVPVLVVYGKKVKQELE